MLRSGIGAGKEQYAKSDSFVKVRCLHGDCHDEATDEDTVCVRKVLQTYPTNDGRETRGKIIRVLFCANDAKDRKCDDRQQRRNGKRKQLGYPKEGHPYYHVST